MEAEELIKYFKKCVEQLNDDFEPIITPTKGNPIEKQTDVSFVIMENVKEGRIPRFTVNVKDY